MAIANYQIVNDEIDCNNEQIAFNQLNCTQTTCHVVKDTSTLNAPGCADAVKVNTLYPHLKSYFNENEALKSQMVTDLSGADTSTPQSKFLIVRNKFSQIFVEFDQIKNGLQKTLDHANKFIKGFKEITNCRLVRQELLAIESSICFGFNDNLYKFFLFLFLFTWFGFFLNLFIFCTMRNSQKKDNDEEEEFKRVDTEEKEFNDEED